MGHNDKPEKVVHTQTEPNEDDLVQKGYNIKEAWDDIYKDEVFDRKTDSKKIDWNLISNNEDIIGIDDEKNNNDDKSDIMTSEKARHLKTSLFDNVGSLDRTEPESLAIAKKRHQKKDRQGSKLISHLLIFSVIIGKIALGEEIGGLLERNIIEKGNLTPLHQNALSKEEITNRQIEGETFRAYKCEEESMSTAEFSLNPPPECRTEDGSAYYKPIEKKAQILQRVRRIPIEITTCVVQ